MVMLARLISYWIEIRFRLYESSSEQSSELINTHAKQKQLGAIKRVLPNASKLESLV